MAEKVKSLDLLALAAEMADECYIGRYDAARVRREVENPEFSPMRGSRDWRSHVPDGFKRIWDDLPFDVRLGIFAMACCSVD